jgi:hypothetical protein
MNTNTLHIVVSRYQRDTNFVYELKDIAKSKGFETKCMVYDKENPRNKYNIPKNVGAEASVY